MSDVLSLDQLLSTTNLRQREYEWRGIGTVVLHEISLDEALLREKEQLEAEGAEDAGRHGARWALRFLKGEFPSDEEIEQFCARYSTDAAKDIYMAGLRFNAAHPDSKEELEKN